MRRRYESKIAMAESRRRESSARMALEEVKALVPGLEENRATVAVARRLREILKMPLDARKE